MSDWGGLKAEFVTTLKEPVIQPVPDEIVKLAQRSLNGVPHPTDPTQKMHVMRIKFESEARANAFAAHMRNAGLHTTPKSSVLVTIDPDRPRVAKLDDNGEPVLSEKGRAVKVPGAPVDPTVVQWKSGERRGRAAS